MELGACFKILNSKKSLNAKQKLILSRRHIERDTNSDLNMNCPPDSNYNDANAEVLRALKGDDRGVFWWKLVVKVMMICVAILLTTMTYVQLSQSEANDFEASVRIYIRKD